MFCYSFKYVRINWSFNISVIGWGDIVLELYVVENCEGMYLVNIENKGEEGEDSEYMLCRLISDAIRRDRRCKNPNIRYQPTIQITSK